jgi:hypothetical protein
MTYNLKSFELAALCAREAVADKKNQLAIAATAPARQIDLAKMDLVMMAPPCALRLHRLVGSGALILSKWKGL